MRKRAPWLVVVVCAVGSWIGVQLAKAPEDETADAAGLLDCPAGFTTGAGGAAPQRGDPAPDFELPRLEGGTVRLSRLQGKPVVLIFGSYT